MPHSMLSNQTATHMGPPLKKIIFARQQQVLFGMPVTEIFLQFTQVLL